MDFAASFVLPAASAAFPASFNFPATDAVLAAASAAAEVPPDDIARAILAITCAAIFMALTAFFISAIRESNIFLITSL